MNAKKAVIIAAIVAGCGFGAVDAQACCSHHYYRDYYYDNPNYYDNDYYVNYEYDPCWAQGRCLTRCELNVCYRYCQPPIRTYSRHC